MNDSINVLKNWLISSGLSVSDEKDEQLGGVHSYFDEKENKYGFLYPEITGYFLSMLRFLHTYEPNNELIKLSKFSAEWLINLKTKYGGIIQGISEDVSKQKITYSFDVGICAKGILDCYVLTQEPKYLKFGKELVNWISEQALEENGTIKPMYNLTTEKFEEDKKIWYKQKGCLHIKTAIPFFQLYNLTKDNSYLEKAELISNTFDMYQNSNGSFSLHENSNTIHMHTLCYALEGLLHAHSTTKSKKYLESCTRALDWCTNQINYDGSINLWFNVKYQQAKTSYHIAQIIRLLVLVNGIRENENYKSSIENLMRFLIILQSSNLLLLMHPFLY